MLLIIALLLCTIGSVNSQRGRSASVDTSNGCICNYGYAGLYDHPLTEEQLSGRRGCDLELYNRLFEKRPGTKQVTNQFWFKLLCGCPAGVMDHGGRHCSYLLKGGQSALLLQFFAGVFGAADLYLERYWIATIKLTAALAYLIHRYSMQDNLERKGGDSRWLLLIILLVWGFDLVTILFGFMSDGNGMPLY